MSIHGRVSGGSGGHYLGIGSAPIFPKRGILGSIFGGFGSTAKKDALNRASAVTTAKAKSAALTFLQKQLQLDQASTSAAVRTPDGSAWLQAATAAILAKQQPPSIPASLLQKKDAGGGGVPGGAPGGGLFGLPTPVVIGGAVVVVGGIVAIASGAFSRKTAA